eukprot:m.342622 g.342622  ORF g.342622 m.342622 type:complete len:292 (-) comp21647_c0_seq1:193-1068(-)
MEATNVSRSQLPLNAAEMGKSGTGLNNDSMSGVIDKLETLFLKAEADLSYAHRKLDNEFHEKYSTYTTDETNPLRVMRRIAQLKEDVALVSKRSQQILTEKEDVAAKLRTSLLESCNYVRELNQLCDIQTDIAEEEQIIRSRTTQTNSKDPLNESYTLEAPTVAKSKLMAVSGGKTKQSHKKKPAARISSVSERGPKKFIPVSVEEFESVSTLVRGRAKLEEVNQVYERLHTFFRQQRKNDSSDSISLKEMSALGLKISGATGEAKLKVLRQLKLVNISNRDKSVSLSFEG